MPPPEDFCSQHSGITENIKDIKETLAEVSINMTKLFDKFEGKIVEYAQRPTWLVCTVISGMSGIIGVLLTFILYAHFGNK